MRKSRLKHTAPWLMLLAFVLLPCTRARASQESVDRKTQAALALDAHPDRGATLFHEHCARCHRADANGDTQHAVPALASQRFAYLVRQLADFAGAQRESATMHTALAEPPLHEPQTWVDIAAYLNGLPLVRRVQVGDAGDTALGRGIYHEQCAGCHGYDARGDTDGFVPSLRHQAYNYLVGQIKQLGAGRRHNVDENLVRFLRSFEADEIASVAKYLAGLQGAVKDRKHMRQDGVVVD